MSEYNKQTVPVHKYICSPSNDEQFGSIDNLCVVEYLEQAIISYIKKLSQRYNKHQTNEVFQFVQNMSDSESECDEDTDINMTLRREFAIGDDEDDIDIPFMITSLKIGDPIENGHITSRNVEFSFYIGEDSSILTKEYFILHAMQDYITDFPQGFLSSLQREIDFHAKLVSEIEDWLNCERHFIPVLSGIHKSYDGILHVDSPKDPFLMQRILKEIETTCNWKIINPEKYLSCTVTRYLVIDQDLEQYEYFKRNCEIELLSINEVKSVLRELAFLQACSWIMEQKTKVNTMDRWTFLQSINAFIVSSIPNVRKGLHEMTQILEGVGLEEPDKEIILKYVKSWKSQVTDLFESKMKHVTGSFPSTLLHLDLNSDSIYFYNDQMNENEADEVHLTKKDSKTTVCPSLVEVAAKADEKGDIENYGESTECKEEMEKGEPLDNSLFDKAYPSDHIICKISNWKSVSYGNPLLDVANLLYTSVDIGSRQIFTKHLLFYYYNIFKTTLDAFDIKMELNFKAIMQDYYNQFTIRILLSIVNITPTMELKSDEIQNLLYGIREYLDTSD